MVAGNQPMLTKTAPLLHLWRDRERQPPCRPGRLVGPAGQLALDPAGAQRLAAVGRGQGWRLTCDSRRRAFQGKPQPLADRPAVVAGPQAADGRSAGLVRDSDPGTEPGPGAAGFPWWLEAVPAGRGPARGAACVWHVAGNHGPGHCSEHRLRHRAGPGADPTAVLGPCPGGRSGGPAVRDLAHRRGTDARRPVWT